MADNGHAVALYIMEMLMNMKAPISLDILSSTLQSTSANGMSFPFDISPYNLSCELQTFLQRYPSLFRVENSVVFPVLSSDSMSVSSLPNNTENYNGQQNCQPMFPELSPSQIPSIPCYSPQAPMSPGNKYAPNYFMVSDITNEIAAVKYFQSHLSRRQSEKWISVRSLAGHLSQASAHIRSVVGSQTDFLNFLRRHQDVFNVQGEFVCLIDQNNPPMYPPSPSHVSSPPSFAMSNRRFNKNRQRRRRSSPGDDTRSVCSNQSYGGTCKSAMSFNANPSYLSPKIEVTVLNHADEGDLSEENVVVLPAVEYSAVMLLRRLLCRVGSQGTHPGLILRRLVRAPPEIREVVGWTRVELEEFLNKHKLFFERVKASLPGYELDSSPGELQHDLLVRVAPNATRLKVRMITGALNANENDSSNGDIAELNGKSGSVFHIAKLWGIIDLGQHEHVFFDKSIFRNVEDLQRHFQPGETVYFNAVVAAKNSRAKWRATRVWKEDDQAALLGLDGLQSVSNGHEIGASFESMKTSSSSNINGDFDRDAMLGLPYPPSVQFPNHLVSGGGLPSNGESIIIDDTMPDLCTSNNNNSNGTLKFTKSTGKANKEHVATSETDQQINLNDEFDDVRFLGDQDLGLSLLSLADLNNLDEGYSLSHDFEDGVTKRRYQGSTVIPGRPNGGTPLLRPKSLTTYSSFGVNRHVYLDRANAVKSVQSTQSPLESDIDDAATMDHIPNLSAESAEDADLKSATTNSSLEATTDSSRSRCRNMAIQTTVTGDFNPMFVFKGSLCAVDESKDSSLSLASNEDCSKEIEVAEKSA